MAVLSGRRLGRTNVLLIEGFETRGENPVVCLSGGLDGQNIGLNEVLLIEGFGIWGENPVVCSAEVVLASLSPDLQRRGWLTR